MTKSPLYIYVKEYSSSAVLCSVREFPRQHLLTLTQAWNDLLCTVHHDPATYKPL